VIPYDQLPDSYYLTESPLGREMRLATSGMMAAEAMQAAILLNKNLVPEWALPPGVDGGPIDDPDPDDAESKKGTHETHPTHDDPVAELLAAAVLVERLSGGLVQRQHHLPRRGGYPQTACRHERLPNRPVCQLRALARHSNNRLNYADSGAAGKSPHETFRPGAQGERA